MGVHDVDTAWFGPGSRIQMDDDLAYKGALNGIGAQGGDAVYVNSFDGPFVKIVSDPLLAKFGFGSKQDCYTQIRWFEIRTHRAPEKQANEL